MRRAGPREHSATTASWQRVRVDEANVRHARRSALGAWSTSALRGQGRLSTANARVASAEHAVEREEELGHVDEQAVRVRERRAIIEVDRNACDDRLDRALDASQIAVREVFSADNVKHVGEQADREVPERLHGQRALEVSDAPDGRHLPAR